MSPTVRGVGRSRKVAYSRAMARGVPARLALVCVLCGAAAADAARRPVAIIDLSADPAAARLRSELFGALVSSWALAPISNTFDRALEGPFLDEDKDRLAAAHAAQVEADDALAQFNAGSAKKLAAEALDRLLAAHPAAGQTLRADLAFALGIAELVARHKDAADQAFALAARLDPARKPDPASYIDDIIKAYDRARAAPVRTVALEVRGSGHVWIDGALVGTAPGTFEVAAGEHLVQLADPDRMTRGWRGVAPSAQPVDIADEPATVELQVRRARLALARAPDATARAGTLVKLAELLHVQDAVLVFKADGELVVQLVPWKDGMPDFSKPLQPVGGDFEKLLEPLSGPKPEVREPPRPPTRPRVDPDPHEGEPVWYRRRWVQATVAGAVVATAVGLFLWTRREQTISYRMKPEWSP